MQTPADVIQQIIAAVNAIFPAFGTVLVAVVLLALGARLLRQFRVLGR
jgi:hypothetical protein